MIPFIYGREIKFVISLLCARYAIYLQHVDVPINKRTLAPLQNTHYTTDHHKLNIYVQVTFLQLIAPFKSPPKCFLCIIDQRISNYVFLKVKSKPSITRGQANDVIYLAC